MRLLCSGRGIFVGFDAEGEGEPSGCGAGYGVTVSVPASGEHRKFDCPVCGFHGLFRTAKHPYGDRKFAICQGCGAKERHRLQWLVMMELAAKYDFSSMRLLHCAPEGFMRERFTGMFGRYESADLYEPEVDHQVDFCALPFGDAEYDCVFASHVLEHIADDRAAIREIHRILKPGGFAVLPVPIVAASTIEYPEANPFEVGHVRAPGPDYLDRYRECFREVVEHESGSFPEEHQGFVYEQRDHWPAPEMPHKKAMPGERHLDIVPVCFV